LEVKYLIKDIKDLQFYWLFFAVSSLMFSGVFAFLAAMTRTPAVKLLPSVDYFQVSIVAHVIFSLTVWFLGFMGALWVYTLPPNTKSHLSNWFRGFWISGIGMLLIGFSSFFGIGKPILIDYVPIIDHPIFFLGLFFLALGIALTIYCYNKLIILDKNSNLDIPSYGMLVVSVITIIAFVSVFFSAIVNGLSNYKSLFWGPGHIIQFANTLSMIVVWFILLEKTIQGRSNEPAVKKLFLVYLLVALTLPMIYLFPALDQIRLFTLGMAVGLGIPSFFLALIVLKSLVEYSKKSFTTKRFPWGNPAFSSLILSILLFGVGGIIGVPGLESNLRVPAHYHGSLGAVTMAFMGMTSVILQRMGIKVYSERIARYQPYLYGLGFLIIIIGLFWAGSYDVPRKAFGYENPLTVLAMNLMGAGAIVAVLGGALFVANTMISLLKGLNQIINK
jgi:heme/copper-type cytochrome/quinol oxidase subunit 1